MKPYPCYWPLTHRATWRERLGALWFALVILIAVLSLMVVPWLLEGGL